MSTETDWNKDVEDNPRRLEAILKNPKGKEIRLRGVQHEHETLNEAIEREALSQRVGPYKIVVSHTLPQNILFLKLGPISGDSKNVRRLLK
jgi:hypothetical protein